MDDYESISTEIFSGAEERPSSLIEPLTVLDVESTTPTQATPLFDMRSQVTASALCLIQAQEELVLLLNTVKQTFSGA